MAGFSLFCAYCGNDLVDSVFDVDFDRYRAGDYDSALVVVTCCGIKGYCSDWRGAEKVVNVVECVGIEAARDCCLGLGQR